MTAACLVAAIALAAGAPWQELEPGLERRAETIGTVQIEALRLDPQLFEARVVLAADLDRRAATAREFAEATGALAAVNGGFFDREMQPIGLRVSRGRPVAGKLGSRLGALVEARGAYRVLIGDDLRNAVAGARELVQCGPRLVVGGAPNGVKAQVSRRTVAGIDRSGRLVLLVTRTGRIDARELAAWLARAEADGGLGLVEALNLDGGGSSQMFLALGGTEILVAGMTPVADALVIFRRGDGGG